MKYRLSILNCAVLIFLAGCITFTLINYGAVSEGEGWGVVFMTGLFVLGLSGLLVDWIIQLLIKNRKQQNITGMIVLLIYLVLFYLGS